ncbi:hypothetical protein L1049_005911 [Liquidambar formosana]|uniref:Phytocyanin domain-containing protein n=1 Tax=Liquidambar formosana TaxID=63359 RepID=A0AAP0RFR7_LIQFO
MPPFSRPIRLLVVSILKEPSQMNNKQAKKDFPVWIKISNGLSANFDCDSHCCRCFSPNFGKGVCVFKYPEGVHNVFEVDKTAFQQCVAPATTEALATGNDVITLATPGRKWYICGVGKHCEARNQKLAITVYPLLGSPATSPSGGGAPSSTPASAGSGITISKYHAWMLAAFGILMIMV